MVNNIDDIEWKHFKLIFKNLTINCATNGEILRLRHAGMIPKELSLEDKEKIEEVYMTEDIVFVEPPKFTKYTVKGLENIGVKINELSIEPHNGIARLIWRMFEKPSRKVFRDTED